MRKIHKNIGIVIIIILTILSSSTSLVLGHISRKTDEGIIDLASLLLFDPVVKGLMNSSWPMKCHDLQHTGRSQYTTANNPPGIEKWEFEAGSWLEDSVVVANDGTIYVGSFDFKLYAINPNGTLKWKYGTAMDTFSAPAIDDDGTIYFTSYDCYLHAINPDGTRKWRFLAAGPLTSSPCIATDGTVYFGSMGPDNLGRIYAINPDGTEQWHYDTGYYIFSDPAIGTDGIIYIGSGDSYLYAMNPNGTLRWRFKTNGAIHGHPSIAADGTIYIGSFDDYLYAVHPNGTLKWNYDIGFGTSGSASIDTDGTIYIATDKLYAIHSDGTTKWQFNLGTGRWVGASSPAISVDGIIYFGTHVGDGADGGEIIAVNRNGTELWRKLIARDWVDSSPCIDSDGTIYIGSSTEKEVGPGQFVDIGILYAFGIGPLTVKANGPYQGHAGLPVQFTGTIFGGIPPYIFHWDFGDGQASDQQNPIHIYNNTGNYTATFTVSDSKGNHSTDNTTVTIIYAPPSVTITKPVNYLYIMNMKILPFPKPFIIGPITIEVEASQIPFGINQVEFFIDGNLKSTDNTAPYSWTWTTPAFFTHTIKVVANDSSGNNASDEITMKKFF